MAITIQMADRAGVFSNTDRVVYSHIYQLFKHFYSCFGNNSVLIHKTIEALQIIVTRSFLHPVNINSVLDCMEISTIS